MNEIEKRFTKPQVLDGGLSTEIAFAHGCPEINGDPLWSSRLILTDPKTIENVHESFLQAGSDIIQTVTYQASINGFVEHLHKSEEEAFNLIVKGVELAVSVRNEYWNNRKTDGSCLQTDRPIVAGSLGPYGACLADGSEYTGSYMETTSKQTLIDFYKPRISALIQGGADIIAFDTVPAKEESLILAEIMQNNFADTLCWISFQCKDEQHIAHGETLKDCGESLLKYKQVKGIGINCTAPQYVTPLLKSLTEAVKTEKTLIVYPNTGEVWTEDNQWADSATEQCVVIQDLVPEWVSHGASWIGGCCQITPQDITKIRTNLYKVISI